MESAKCGVFQRQGGKGLRKHAPWNTRKKRTLNSARGHMPIQVNEREFASWMSNMLIQMGTLYTVPRMFPMIT